MQTWYKHPALWLSLLFSAAAMTFVLTSPRWTATRIADAWRREISDAEDEQAVALLPRLARLNEVAVPHLVQLLDDDREPLRHAAREVLREKFNTWLRERSPVDQRCLATLAHEFASQPLPRDERERDFVKQVSLKLLRWPGEEGSIHTAQLLLDCTATLQHIAESRVLPIYNVAALSSKKAMQDQPPASLSLSDMMEETPLADVEPPAEPAPLMEREPLPQRTLEEDEPSPLSTEGNERLIPPERFVPETPRRLRDSEMNLNDDEDPSANISPTSNADSGVVQVHALRELDTRSVIRHLHGLPTVTQAAETELRKRGFSDSTLQFAKQLDDEDPQVRLKLVEALPYVKQIDATSWLFELLNDSDPKVRTAARNILSTSRNPMTQKRLGNPTRR